MLPSSLNPFTSSRDAADAAPPAPAQRHITVGGTTYTVVGRLGEGAFSVVEKCTAPNGHTVAVKVMQVSPEQLPQVQRELSLHAALAHENIVRCLGTSTGRRGSTTTATVALECGKATVVTLMQHRQKQSMHFSEAEVLTIAGSVAHALVYLHSMSPPVAHRDLKPENVLAFGNGVYKLADFGSATRVAFDCENNSDVTRAEDELSRLTTMAYRSPEMVDLWRRQRVDERSDVWAFGVFLYYIMYFALPFEETKLSILRATYVIPSGAPAFSRQLAALLKGCLVADPDRRWTMRAVVEHMHAAWPGVVRPPPPAPSSQTPQPLASFMSKLQQQHAPDAPAQQQGGASGTTSNTALGASGPAAGGGDLFAMLNWQQGADAAKVVPSHRPEVDASVVSQQGMVQPAVAPRTPPSAACGANTTPLAAQPAAAPNASISPTTHRTAVQSHNSSNAPALVSGGGVDLFSSWGAGASPAFGDSVRSDQQSQQAATPVPAPPADLFAAPHPATSPTPAFDVTGPPPASRSPRPSSQASTPAAAMDTLFGPPLASGVSGTSAGHSRTASDASALDDLLSSASPPPGPARAAAGGANQRTASNASSVNVDDIFASQQPQARTPQW